MRSSTEHYDRVGVSFRWPQILAAASSIFFGFFLDIAVNPPLYFSLSDNMILLTSLYAVAISTVMFIMPVIYHISRYLRFDVERFLARTRHYVLIGIICIMLAMYFGLGLAMHSKLPTLVAYSLPTVPFIFITIESFRDCPTNPVKSTSTERYDRMGAAMRWCQILASGSSIFFGFLLRIAVDPPSYFTFFDNMMLLASLYAVTVATAMFILPVLYHMKYYRRLDVERFLLRTKKPVQIGIICIALALSIGLGLALNSKLPIEVAYILASIPSIFIFYEFFNLRRK